MHSTLASLPCVFACDEPVNKLVCLSIRHGKQVRLSIGHGKSSFLNSLPELSLIWFAIFAPASLSFILLGRFAFVFATPQETLFSSRPIAADGFAASVEYQGRNTCRSHSSNGSSVDAR
jgi:hypothetical protein